MLDAGELSSDEFRAHLNQTFLIHHGHAVPLEAELIEVSEFGSDSSRGRQPFSIIFRSLQKDEYLI